MTAAMTARLPGDEQEGPSREPVLSAVVVHWRDEGGIGRLIESWPRDPRWELVVVDNSASLGELPSWLRRVDPGQNLGFAGGCNRGRRVARGEWLLFLNPDARPEPGALDALLATTETLDDAAGLVPALVDETGRSQHRWQLQKLPTASDLVRKTLPGVPALGPEECPAAGAPIEQPAAAALALRTAVFDAIGGFDPAFYPAWYEDVDLARRLHDAGHRLLYTPSARFVHAGGATLGPLGADYPWLHFRNLERYLAKHHPKIRSAARWGMVVGALFRWPAFCLLALWPGDGTTRRSPAGPWRLLVGALSGFRRPRRLVVRATPPPADDGGETPGRVGAEVGHG